MNLLLLYYNRILLSLKQSVRKLFCLKGVAIIILLAFVSQQAAYAGPLKPSSTNPQSMPMLSQATLSEIIESPSKLRIPLDFVSVEEIHQGVNGKLIIHIQDAHSNLSGQQSLSNALNNLLTDHDIPLILSEGGSQDASLSSIRNKMDAKDLKKAAKRLLFEGLINGQEYLDLTSTHTMQIIGIENQELYQNNLEIFYELKEHRQDILEYLRQIKISIERIKNKLYPQELLNLERDIKADASKELQLILEMAQTKNISIEEFRHIQQLKALKTKEALINFERANYEQQLIMDQLELTHELTQMIQSMPQSSAEHRLAFVDHIFLLAGQKNINTTAYREIQRYRDYLVGYAELDLHQVIEESNRLKKNVYAKSLQTSELQTLRASDDYLELLIKAYRIQMTSEDYSSLKFYQQNVKIQAWQAFLNQRLTELNYFDDLIIFQDHIEKTQSLINEFYELVNERDMAFMQNTKRILKDQNQDAAFFIAGGYHTQHLTQLLKEEGYSYVVLSPHVKYATDQNKYEDLLLAGVEQKRTDTLAQSLAAEAGASVRMIQYLSRSESVRENDLVDLIINRQGLSRNSRMVEVKKQNIIETPTDDDIIKAVKEFRSRGIIHVTKKMLSEYFGYEEAAKFYQRVGKMRPSKRAILKDLFWDAKERVREAIRQMVASGWVGMTTDDIADLADVTKDHLSRLRGRDTPFSKELDEVISKHSTEKKVFRALLELIQKDNAFLTSKQIAAKAGVEEGTISVYVSEGKLLGRWITEATNSTQDDYKILKSIRNLGAADTDIVSIAQISKESKFGDESRVYRRMRENLIVKKAVADALNKNAITWDIFAKWKFSETMLTRRLKRVKLKPNKWDIRFFIDSIEGGFNELNAKATADAFIPKLIQRKGMEVARMAELKRFVKPRLISDEDIIAKVMELRATGLIGIDQALLARELGLSGVAVLGSRLRNMAPEARRQYKLLKWSIRRQVNESIKSLMESGAAIITHADIARAMRVSTQYLYVLKSKDPVIKKAVDGVAIKKGVEKKTFETLLNLIDLGNSPLTGVFVAKEAGVVPRMISKYSKKGDVLADWIKESTRPTKIDLQILSTIRDLIKEGIEVSRVKIINRLGIHKSEVYRRATFGLIAHEALEEYKATGQATWDIFAKWALAKEYLLEGMAESGYSPDIWDIRFFIDSVEGHFNELNATKAAKTFIPKLIYRKKMAARRAFILKSVRMADMAAARMVGNLSRKQKIQVEIDHLWSADKRDERFKELVAQMGFGERPIPGVGSILASLYDYRNRAAQRNGVMNEVFIANWLAENIDGAEILAMQQMWSKFEVDIVFWLEKHPIFQDGLYFVEAKAGQYESFEEIWDRQVSRVSAMTGPLQDLGMPVHHIIIRRDVVSDTSIQTNVLVKKDSLSTKERDVYFAHLLGEVKGEPISLEPPSKPTTEQMELVKTESVDLLSILWNRLPKLKTKSYLEIKAEIDKSLMAYEVSELTRDPLAQLEELQKIEVNKKSNAWIEVFNPHVNSIGLDEDVEIRIKKTLLNYFNYMWDFQKKKAGERALQRFIGERGKPAAWTWLVNEDYKSRMADSDEVESKKKANINKVLNNIWALGDEFDELRGLMHRHLLGRGVDGAAMPGLGNLLANLNLMSGESNPLKDLMTALVVKEWILENIQGVQILGLGMDWLEHNVDIVFLLKGHDVYADGLYFVATTNSDSINLPRIWRENNAKPLLSTEALKKYNLPVHRMLIRHGAEPLIGHPGPLLKQEGLGSGGDVYFAYNIGSSGPGLSNEKPLKPLQEQVHGLANESIDLLRFLVDNFDNFKDTNYEDVLAEADSATKIVRSPRRIKKVVQVVSGVKAGPQVQNNPKTDDQRTQNLINDWVEHSLDYVTSLGEFKDPRAELQVALSDFITHQNKKKMSIGMSRGVLQGVNFSGGVEGLWEFLKNKTYASRMTGVDQWVEGLASRDKLTRNTAIRALIDLENKPPELESVLADRLGEDYGYLAAVAVLATLAEMSGASDATIDEIVISLDDTSKRVQDAAVVALSALAGTNKYASNILSREVLHDYNSPIEWRILSIQTLINRNNRTSSVIGLLRESMGQEPSYKVVEYLIENVSKLGKHAVPIVLFGFEREDNKFDIDIIELLGDMGINAIDALDVLKPMMDRTPDNVLGNAAHGAVASISNFSSASQQIVSGDYRVKTLDEIVLRPTRRDRRRAADTFVANFATTGTRRVDQLVAASHLIDGDAYDMQIKFINGLLNAHYDGRDVLIPELRPWLVAILDFDNDGEVPGKGLAKLRDLAAEALEGTPTSRMAGDRQQANRLENSGRDQRILRFNGPQNIKAPSDAFSKAYKRLNNKMLAAIWSVQTWLKRELLTDYLGKTLTIKQRLHFIYMRAFGAALITASVWGAPYLIMKFGFGHQLNLSFKQPFSELFYNYILPLKVLDLTFVISFAFMDRYFKAQENKALRDDLWKIFLDQEGLKHTLKTLIKPLEFVAVGVLAPYILIASIEYTQFAKNVWSSQFFENVFGLTSIGAILAFKGAYDWLAYKDAEAKLKNLVGIISHQDTSLAKADKEFPIFSSLGLMGAYMSIAYYAFSSIVGFGIEDVSLIGRVGMVAISFYLVESLYMTQKLSILKESANDIKNQAVLKLNMTNYEKRSLWSWSYLLGVAGVIVLSVATYRFNQWNESLVISEYLNYVLEFWNIETKIPTYITLDIYIWLAVLTFMTVFTLAYNSIAVKFLNNQNSTLQKALFNAKTPLKRLQDGSFVDPAKKPARLAQKSTPANPSQRLVNELNVGDDQPSSPLARMAGQVHLEALVLRMSEDVYALVLGDEASEFTLRKFRALLAVQKDGLLKKSEYFSEVATRQPLVSHLIHLTGVLMKHYQTVKRADSGLQQLRAIVQQIDEVVLPYMRASTTNYSMADTFPKFGHWMALHTSQYQQAGFEISQNNFLEYVREFGDYEAAAARIGLYGLHLRDDFLPGDMVDVSGSSKLYDFVLPYIESVYQGDVVGITANDILPISRAILAGLLIPRDANSSSTIQDQFSKFVRLREHDWIMGKIIKDEFPNVDIASYPDLRLQGMGVSDKTLAMLDVYNVNTFAEENRISILKYAGGHRLDTTSNPPIQNKYTDPARLMGEWDFLHSLPSNAPRMAMDDSAITADPLMASAQTMGAVREVLQLPAMQKIMIAAFNGKPTNVLDPLDPDMFDEHVISSIVHAYMEQPVVKANSLVKKTQVYALVRILAFYSIATRDTLDDEIISILANGNSDQIQSMLFRAWAFAFGFLIPNIISPLMDSQPAMRDEALSTLGLAAWSISATFGEADYTRKVERRMRRGGEPVGFDNLIRNLNKDFGYRHGFLLAHGMVEVLRRDEILGLTFAPKVNIRIPSATYEGTYQDGEMGIKRMVVQTVLGQSPSLEAARHVGGSDIISLNSDGLQQNFELTMLDLRNAGGETEFTIGREFYIKYLKKALLIDYPGEASEEFVRKLVNEHALLHESSHAIDYLRGTEAINEAAGDQEAYAELNTMLNTGKPLYSIIMSAVNVLALKPGAGINIVQKKYLRIIDTLYNYAREHDAAGFEKLPQIDSSELIDNQEATIAAVMSQIEALFNLGSPGLLALAESAFVDLFKTQPYIFKDIIITPHPQNELDSIANVQPYAVPIAVRMAGPKPGKLTILKRLIAASHGGDIANKITKLRFIRNILSQSPDEPQIIRQAKHVVTAHISFINELIAARDFENVVKHIDVVQTLFDEHRPYNGDRDAAVSLIITYNNIIARFHSNHLEGVDAYQIKARQLFDEILPLDSDMTQEADPLVSGYGMLAKSHLDHGAFDKAKEYILEADKLFREYAVPNKGMYLQARNVFQAIAKFVDTKGVSKADQLQIATLAELYLADYGDQANPADIATFSKYFLLDGDGATDSASNAENGLDDTTRVSEVAEAVRMSDTGLWLDNLGSKDKQTREAAIEGLIELEDKPDALANTLRQKLEDQTGGGYVKVVAILRALSSFEVLENDVIEQIALSLSNKKFKRIREEAARTLITLSSKNPHASIAILKLITTDYTIYHELRRFIIKEIVARGYSATKNIRILKKIMLNDPNQESIELILRELPKLHKYAVDVYVEGLSRSDARYSLDIIKGLENLKAEAIDASDTLQAIIKSEPDSEMGKAALQVYKNLQGHISGDVPMSSNHYRIRPHDLKIVPGKTAKLRREDASAVLRSIEIGEDSDQSWGDTLVWVTHLIDGDDYRTQSKFINRLVQIEKNKGKSVLIDELEPWFLSIIAFIDNLPESTDLTQELYNAAQLALEYYEPEEVVDDSDELIVQISDPAGQWVRDLRSSDNAVRTEAVRLLSDREFHSEDLASALTSMLRTQGDYRDNGVVEALEVLAAFEYPGSAYLEEIRESLFDDRSEDIVVQAIKTLSELAGTNPTAAQILVREVMENGEFDKEFRTLVLQHILEHGHLSKEVLVLLKRSIKKEQSPQVMQYLLDNLPILHKHAAVVYLAGLERDDGIYILNIINALGSMKLNSIDALGALNKLANNGTSHEIRSVAQRNYAIIADGLLATEPIESRQYRVRNNGDISFKRRVWLRAKAQSLLDSIEVDDPDLVNKVLAVSHIIDGDNYEIQANFINQLLDMDEQNGIPVIIDELEPWLVSIVTFFENLTRDPGIDMTALYEVAQDALNYLESFESEDLPNEPGRMAPPKIIDLDKQVVNARALDQLIQDIALDLQGQIFRDDGRMVRIDAGLAGDVMYMAGDDGLVSTQDIMRSQAERRTKPDIDLDYVYYFESTPPRGPEIDLEEYISGHFRKRVMAIPDYKKVFAQPEIAGIHQNISFMEMNALLLAQTHRDYFDPQHSQDDSAKQKSRRLLMLAKIFGEQLSTSAAAIKLVIERDNPMYESIESEASILDFVAEMRAYFDMKRNEGNWLDILFTQGMHAFLSNPVNFANMQTETPALIQAITQKYDTFRNGTRMTNRLAFPRELGSMRENNSLTELELVLPDVVSRKEYHGEMLSLVVAGSRYAGVQIIGDDEVIVRDQNENTRTLHVTSRPRGAPTNRLVDFDAVPNLQQIFDEFDSFIEGLMADTSKTHRFEILFEKVLDQGQKDAEGLAKYLSVKKGNVDVRVGFFEGKQPQFTNEDGVVRVVVLSDKTAQAERSKPALQLPSGNVSLLIAQKFDVSSEVTDIARTVIAAMELHRYEKAEDAIRAYDESPALQSSIKAGDRAGLTKALMHMHTLPAEIEQRIVAITAIQKFPVLRRMLRNTLAAAARLASTVLWSA